jgi:exonuclease 3'-5' domain-containing protein 1
MNDKNWFDIYVQLGFPDAIHLVDAIKGGKVLIVARKPTLESEFVTKVTYDCKRDSEVSDLFDLC